MRHLYLLFILLQISFLVVSADATTLSTFEEALESLQKIFVKIAPLGPSITAPDVAAQKLIADLKKQLEQADKDKKKLQEQISNLRKDVTVGKENAGNLRAKVGSLDAALDFSKKEVDRLNEEIAKLKRTTPTPSPETAKKIKDLEEEVKKKDADNKAKEAEVANLINKIATLEEDLAKKNAAKAYNGEADGYASSIASLSVDVKAAKSEANLEVLNMKVAYFSTQKEAFSKALDNLDAKIEAAKAELADVDYTALKAKVTEIKKQLNAISFSKLEERVTKLFSDQVAQIQAEGDKLVTDVTAPKRAWASVTDSAKLQSDLKALKASQTALNTQIENAKLKIPNLWLSAGKDSEFNSKLDALSKKFASLDFKPIEDAITALLVPATPTTAPVGAGVTYKRFIQWWLATKKLPYFRKIGSNYTNTSLTKDELMRVVDEFIKTLSSASSALTNSSLWMDKAPKLTDNFFTSQVELNPIQPFVQKRIVQPGSVISFHGDMHGDVHSLLECIRHLQTNNYMDSVDAFKIKDVNKFYMVFLGDYTDRGNYGTEVLYTLMRLKIANPDNVILVRGNHEDHAINENYGFIDELAGKFDDLTVDETNKIMRIYDLLPVALYLGCGSKTNKNFIQCCHGGMEPGFNPQKLIDSDDDIKYQWLGKLNQKTALKINKSLFTGVSSKLKDFEPNKFTEIGFMWNDFHVNPNTPLSFLENRGFQYSKAATADVLNASSTTNNRIRGVFRAHQHQAFSTPMMKSILHLDSKDPLNKGVSKLWETTSTKNLWDGIVCTFLVSPDTVYSKQNAIGYPGFTFDAFGLLKTTPEFKDWTLDVILKQILETTPIKKVGQKAGENLDEVIKAGIRFDAANQFYADELAVVQRSAGHYEYCRIITQHEDGTYDVDLGGGVTKEHWPVEEIGEVP